MAVPNRSTPEQQLDKWNDQLRASALWQDWMHRHGKIQGGRMIGLSDREQDEFERYLAQNGVKIPKGMHIDQGGNVNQKNRLWRNVAIGAGIGAGALTGLGAAGIGPFSGMFAAAPAAAPAAASSALPSSSLPAAALMAGPAAITSQGVSSGLGLGLGSAVETGGSFLGRMGNRFADAATSPRGIASLVGVAPSLWRMFGGDDDRGPFGAGEAGEDLIGEIRQNLGLQRERFQESKPAFDAAQRMAIGMAPTRYR